MIVLGLRHCWSLLISVGDHRCICITFDQHEHGTIIDIVEDGGKHDILELHLQDGRDVDMRRLVPEHVVAAKIEEIEAKKLQDAENKKSLAALDLRSLEEKLNNLKLDLRTFEVNLGPRFLNRGWEGEKNNSGWIVLGLVAV